MHVGKSSSACDNTRNERMFSNSIFRVAHTKHMPSLSLFMFRTVFAWAYKSDIVKIFCYSCTIWLESFGWKIKAPRSVHCEVNSGETEE